MPGMTSAPVLMPIGWPPDVYVEITPGMPSNSVMPLSSTVMLASALSWAATPDASSHTIDRIEKAKPMRMGVDGTIAWGE